jgi:hypothetical protein
MSAKSDDKNPVVRIHHGVEVHKVNRLHLHFNEFEYMKLLNIWEASGKKISLTQILALQGGPCQVCGHANVCIPKGVLDSKKQV